MRLTAALFSCSLSLLLPLCLGGAETPPSASPPAGPSAGSYPLEAFSAIGSALAQHNRLADLGWTDAQLGAFLDGIRATVQGKSRPFDAAARSLSEDMSRRIAELTARERQQAFARPGALEQYMKETRKRFSLQQTDSGLAYGIKSGGTGVRPGADDTVVISYTASASDAETELPQLTTDHQRVKVSALLPGLAEGVQMMTRGSRAMFVLPPALSFGEGKWPDGVDAKTPLVFLFVLHNVVGGTGSP
ncbi:MAG: FKBP-type peptidyl-prolyl cis-trans isomerase N-terminal domain-containing protein [Pseudomonadota bacterium]